MRSSPLGLSVVIPCRNGAPFLADQLEALTGQSWGGSWEVVVADNGSTDESQAIARRYEPRLPSLRLIDASAGPGPAYARNIGARNARGELLLFVDHDDVVAPGYVEAMANALLHAPFVCARMEFDRLNQPWVVDVRRAPGQQDLLIDEFGFLPHAGASSLGIRRTLFDRVDGFDPSFLQYAEVDFCWRIQLAGYGPPVIVPDAVVHVRLPTELRGMFRQASRYGRGQTRIRTRYGALLPPPGSRLAQFGAEAHEASRMRTKADLALVIWRVGVHIGRVRGGLSRNAGQAAISAVRSTRAVVLRLASVVLRSVRS